jgi:V/A-type H+-transporting ATPase subunit I
MDSSFEFIFSVYFLLQDIRDFLRAKSRGIFVTKYFFYLEGFVPETEIKKLKEFLKNFKDVYIREMSPEHGEYERIPVVLKNPSFFKNFEPLIEFFSLPVYRSFDPTPLIGIFFPVYFGFMLGDMGYGLLGSLLFLFLYFKFKDNLFIRRISFVFLMAALSSIFFGFLYMEMFGDVLEKMGFHPIFHRVHSANTYLLIALVFGTIQIIMGLLLGIWNNIRLGHNKHAIGVLTMLLGLLCVLGLAGTSLRVLPSSLGPIFLILLFVFMILSFIFHGPAAPIEIFSAFAHILSFARLMAIGLSSAIIAMIANSFLNLLPSLFIGILAMFLFHILAFVLGLFDPTVQGLRLQFVEFFTKFYSPGGRIYSPFYKRLKGVQIPNMIK